MLARLPHALLLTLLPALLALTLLGFRPGGALTKASLYFVPDLDSLRVQREAGRLTEGITMPGLVVFDREGRTVLQALSAADREHLGRHLATLDRLIGATPLPQGLTRQNLAAHLDTSEAQRVILTAPPRPDLTIVSIRPDAPLGALPEGAQLADDPLETVQSFQAQATLAVASLAERHPALSILHIDAVFDAARLRARYPNLQVHARMN